MGTHEFNSRIEAQRAILKVVNERHWEAEPLLSLSRKGIDRWIKSNQIDADSRLVALLLDVSASLFFLANRSQEQISDEYRSKSERIHTLRQEIQRELALG